MADQLTPVGEAFEQADDGLRQCWDAVADLIRGDLDRMATGTYRFADAVTVGARLLQVGVHNVFTLSEVLSDNIALLAVDPSGTGPPPEGVTSVIVAVPAAEAVTVRSTELVGQVTGYRAPRTRVTLDHPVFAAGAARTEVVGVTVAARGLPNDTYTGELVVEAASGTVATPYIVGLCTLPG